MRLEELLAKRDGYGFGTPGWDTANEEKAQYLEDIKPSTKERIIYFEESDLAGIGKGYTDQTDIFDLPFGVERRSLLEYHPTRRHPIPYILVKYIDRYFFALREQGGGELRLIGKKGLIGGHIGEEDLAEGDLTTTFQNALFREAKEEAGISEEMIDSVRLRGLINSDIGVDIDHLGLVYEMELNTDTIKSEEEGVLAGIWIEKGRLPEHYDSFENWSKIVYDNILIS